MRISTKGTFDHSVHPPLFSAEGRRGAGEGVLNLLHKGRLDKTSVFRWKGAGKQEVTFFRGGCSFSTKNKLKSGIFNDKKIYEQECFALL